MATTTEGPIVIRPVNFQRAEVEIVGIAPLMQMPFSEKARHKMMGTQAAGQQARSKRTRDARDFDADYAAAFHRDAEQRCGHPASAFRNALISACRLAGFVMTRAKLSVFVEQDSLDVVDGTPLVLIRGEPERTEMAVRNADGSADIRVRPMWREWTATLHLKWDADQFSLDDVINLLDRAGQQVGIGEGRPDSKKSNGIGFGMFQVRRA